jgi:hypothetical protein
VYDHQSELSSRAGVPWATAEPIRTHPVRSGTVHAILSWCRMERSMAHII